MKVSVKAFEQSIEALKSEERNIKRLSMRIETMQDGLYSNLVSNVTLQRIQVVQESLQLNRKQIYEVIYSLERIRNLYQKCEDDLLEECLDNGVRRTRTAISVAINFNQEEMQLIDLIKL